MSVTTVIGPPEPSPWRLEPSVFAEVFERDWPGATIRWSKDPTSDWALHFELPTEHAFTGSFARDGRAIAIGRGANEDIGALAVWFRGLVPPSQPLEVWSGSGEFCALTPGMTVSDFLRDFHY